MAKSAFYDIADTPEEAANLTARSLVMIALEERIKEQGWTQTEAAEKLHVNQPRVSDLLNGKLHKFSLDALVNMLPAVGLTFDVRPIEPPRRRSVGPAASDRATRGRREKNPGGKAASKRPAPKTGAVTRKV